MLIGVVARGPARRSDVAPRVRPVGHVAAQARSGQWFRGFRLGRHRGRPHGTPDERHRTRQATRRPLVFFVAGEEAASVLKVALIGLITLSVMGLKVQHG
jgi:hypothetical protein